MERPRDALREGTKLAGYVIGRVLGRGGFGITYFGHDALFPETKVAIKEFLPSGLAVREPGTATVHPSGADRAADFKWALTRFEDEARTLVALRHPNVVEVQRYVEANGTAYVVMRFEEGKSLADLLEGERSLTAGELAQIVGPLLDGLEAVHARNYLHRDIKPGNIYVRAGDGSPVLLDFGAARQAMGVERKTSLTEIVTPGYAPFEQYFRKGEQGPWTDIYALGATFYRCVTGKRPPDAPERVRRDQTIAAREAGRGRYPDKFLTVIDAMLAVDERMRPQSIAEVRRCLAAGVPDPAPPNAPPPKEVPAKEARSTIVVDRSPPAADPPPIQAPAFEWRNEDDVAPKPALPPQPVRVPPPQSRPLPLPPVPTQPRRPMFAALVVVAAIAAGAYFVVTSGEQRPAAAVAPATLSDGQVFRDCAECPEVVVIPAGMFTMGSPSYEPSRKPHEGPQREVRIARRFAMGRFEITFAEFDACVAGGGCTRRPEEGTTRPYPNEPRWGRGRQPVVNITWAEARQYTAWLSRKTGKTYRLPSEAEWEYAARAGTTTMFSMGQTISTDLANYEGVFATVKGEWEIGMGVSRGKPSPVGSFAANRFGLHDMHGNVGEFVEDCWNERYAGAPTDGTAWLAGNCSRRVVRGGGWSTYPWEIRSASRTSSDTTQSWSTGNNQIGFRVVRTLD